MSFPIKKPALGLEDGPYYPLSMFCLCPYHILVALFAAVTVDLTLYAWLGVPCVQDFEEVDPKCPTIVREAFTQLLSLANQGDEGTRLVCDATMVVMHNWYGNFALLCKALFCADCNHLYVRYGYTI